MAKKITNQEYKALVLGYIDEGFQEIILPLSLKLAYKPEEIGAIAYKDWSTFLRFKSYKTSKDQMPEVTLSRDDMGFHTNIMTPTAFYFPDFKVLFYNPSSIKEGDLESTIKRFEESKQFKARRK